MQLARCMGLFYRLRNFVSRETLCMLYYSLVHIRIQYKITTWAKAKAKFFCRYIYRCQSEAHKKIQLQTTSRMLERFIYKAFLLEQDVRKQLRACPPLLLLPVYILSRERTPLSRAGNHTGAGAKVLTNNSG